MRHIMHLDYNYYFAQVEIFRDPQLRGRPIAVCGSKEDRHGIVLTKCPIAKKAGVKTGMAIWQAQQLCPGLIKVPPHLDEYKFFSMKMREILYRYTDLIEEYGLDECWAEITAGMSLYGNAFLTAQKIQADVLDELGLTLSVGLSFTKKFAKLGSDMAGAGEICHITPENFRELVWPLDAGELIFIGRKTKSKLARHNIRTMGEVANANPQLLLQWFGVNGLKHWIAANGMDTDRVSPRGYKAPIKSVSKGITCRADLYNADEVKPISIYLSQQVAKKLRVEGYKAKVIFVYLGFYYKNVPGGRSFVCKLEYHTNSWQQIHGKAMDLVSQYNWFMPIRKLVIYATNLDDISQAEQLSIFENDGRKRDMLEKTFFDIKDRFGDDAICTLEQLRENKLPTSNEYSKMQMPKFPYR